MDGARVEALCNEVFLFVNKNTVPGDKSAMVPHGVRLGSPALTTRGLVEKDFEQVAEFVDRAIKIAKSLKKKSGAKLSDFKSALQEEKNKSEEINNLRSEVVSYARQFPVPGVN